jgi:hypothetical protein
MTDEELQRLLVKFPPGIPAGWVAGVKYAGRCATCKHWKQPASEHNPGYFERGGLPESDLGECMMARNDYQQGSCEQIIPRETLAWAEDGESYHAALITFRQFGCVQWQAK